jgi:predicted flap endonuclease-1-like 5' DNA nuclease
MSLLYRIVYAAHANGTHHKLALDALRRLRDPHAERWRNLFLKHVDAYLEGSKAPDKEFKDFKNHVLHVRDDYWGGAPEKAVAWYGRLTDALRRQAWRDAAYAAGVLSHYYTDPIQPFHTAQSEAENAIHRACEWSISRSYDELAKLGRARRAHSEVVVPPGKTWLKEMVCRGAELSNASYEKLIAHYDIHRGIVDPPEGLDETARVLIAELLVYAANGFAEILERAFAESRVTPPEVSLTLATFLAAAQIPSKWIEKRLANAQDRAVVHAMFEELRETGRVAATLPEDDRVVRDLYELEVEGPRADKRAAARAKRIATASEAAPAAAKAATPKAPAAEAATPKAPAARAPAAKAPLHRPAAQRVYLTTSDDIEAAPSIGPRSAEWFAEIGIFTVGDFLAAEPQKTAEALGQGGITAETLRLWQMQARLVMSVPGLRGTHAQLLVGAGYLDAAAVAAADRASLCAAILRFAASPDGQRILRKGEPPAAEKIKGWIDAAAGRRAA